MPVELTYLQLTFLDLAANRLASLPVELRLVSSQNQVLCTQCIRKYDANPALDT